MTLAEAHKTGRKYRRPTFDQEEYIRYGVHPAIGSPSDMDHAIADDWEVEPEVYTTVCKWEERDGWIAPFRSGGSENMTFRANRGTDKLIGKRTKLTIEVLD